MLDYVKGMLVAAEPNYAVIDTGGWGFKLNISFNTYNSIKSYLHEQVKLYTHLLIKEDAIELVGFYDKMERETFLLLIRVPGIGLKVSMSMLSLLNVSKLKSAILSDNSSVLASVPGVGKKTAQKIIIELKDRIKDLPIDSQKDVESDALYEVKRALESLGFKSNEIQAVLNEYSVSGISGESAEEILKKTLKKLSK
ncbi:MAG: Holliday junction branch migration protein RuvA [Tepidanaerobacteraceae bacterium]|jgi:Holliday junction DNA helicase RuvA|nr:Holliday junction branch migration protein RuvA [Tepidanaerobacteraceae bacterium]